MNKAKFLVNAVHWGNLVGIGAQVLQYVPQRPWVMILQAALSAALPSLHGVGHTFVFGGKQEDSVRKP